MDIHEIWAALARGISEIPRSGLLMATVGALVGSLIGSAIARRFRGPGRRIGRGLASLSTVALACILVTVVLQISRFDPRVDFAVPALGMPEQTVSGGETRIALAPDGHYWVRARINGVRASFLVDTGATLTAVSAPLAQKAGLEPRDGGIPVLIETANGTASTQLTTIDRLAFGNIQAGGLDAVIAPNLGNTNVLGMNLLSRLAGWRVENGVLILVPHHPTGENAG
jgi:aspartyl protease family protein